MSRISQLLKDCDLKVFSKYICLCRYLFLLVRSCLPFWWCSLRDLVSCQGSFAHLRCFLVFYFLLSHKVHIPETNLFQYRITFTEAGSLSKIANFIWIDFTLVRCGEFRGVQISMLYCKKRAVSYFLSFSQSPGEKHPSANCVNILQLFYQCTMWCLFFRMPLCSIFGHNWTPNLVYDIGAYLMEKSQIYVT